MYTHSVKDTVIAEIPNGTSSRRFVSPGLYWITVASSSAAYGAVIMGLDNGNDFAGGERVVGGAFLVNGPPVLIKVERGEHYVFGLLSDALPTSVYIFLTPALKVTQ